METAGRNFDLMNGDMMNGAAISGALMRGRGMVSNLMPDELNFHALAAQRKRSGQDPLLAFLTQARKSAVTLSARDVHRIDSQRLQILLSAQAQWMLDNATFQVTDMSDAFRAGLARLGLAPDYFDPAHADKDAVQ